MVHRTNKKKRKKTNQINNSKSLKRKPTENSLSVHDFFILSNWFSWQLKSNKMKWNERMTEMNENNPGMFSNWTENEHCDDFSSFSFLFEKQAEIFNHTVDVEACEFNSFSGWFWLVGSVPIWLLSWKWSESPNPLSHVRCVFFSLSLSFSVYGWDIYSAYANTLRPL